MPRIPGLWFALALAALAAAPPAMGQPGAVASMEAAAVELEGQATVSGTLVAFRSLPIEPGTSEVDRVAPASLLLNAAAIEATTEEESTPLTVGTLAPAPEFSAHPDSFSEVTVTGLAARPRFSFFLAATPGQPAPTASVDADAGALQPADAGEVQQERHLNGGRDPLSASTAGAATWSAPDGWQRLTVTGSFTMALWDWDVQARDSARSETLESGYEFEPAAPTPALPVQTVGTERFRVVYLEVTQGTLEFTFGAPASAELLLAVASVESAGTIQFHEPTGILHTEEGEISLGGERRVSATGPLTADIRPIQGGRFPVDLYGADQAYVGQQQVTLRAQAPAQGALWLEGGLPALALAVATIGLVTLARHRRRRHLARLEHGMAQGDYAWVAGNAGRLVSSHRFGRDARLLKAVALLRLGKLREVEGHLASAPWTAGERPVQAYLRAHLLVVQGDRDGAVSNLQECLSQAPEMASEVAANPVLRDLARHPTLRSVASAAEGYA